jgi:hypothetical protein
MDLEGSGVGSIELLSREFRAGTEINRVPPEQNLQPR